MSKTEYVIYGSHQRLKKEDSVILSCNGSPVTESDSFKYLGVVIDKHLQKQQSYWARTQQDLE